MNVEIDNLIQENLVMLENSLKIKSSHVAKIRNPYQRFTTIKPDVEFIKEIYPITGASVPSQVLQSQTKILDGGERRESQPNWLPPARVLHLYSDILTPYEKDEIMGYSKVYFIGSKAAEKKRSRFFSIESNFGFDDKDGSYNHVTHDHVAYRYEVLRVLGQGSFGQVVKVFDHKKKEFQALKIVKNDKRFLQQAKKEVKILEHIRKEDKENNSNTIHILNSFLFRQHVCIVFELMSFNMYELIRRNKFKGFSQPLVRNFAYSILVALNMLRKLNIIHGDLKPENILQRQSGKSGIKVIDFGSSCYEDSSGAKLFTYVQSRFYRAPEVILGCQYNSAIDMWSYGCVVAELLLGVPLLPGEDEDDQMALTVELLGLPPSTLTGRRAQQFFTLHPSLGLRPRYLLAEPRPGRAVRGPPGSRSLAATIAPAAHNQEELVLLCDFLRGCLTWSPVERLSPEQALHHPWLGRGRHRR